MLDFKKQNFVKEKIDSQTLMPSCFSTVQTKEGSIYMIGGIVKDMVLKNTFVLNENLVYDEVAMMKIGRYSAPT